MTEQRKPEGHPLVVMAIGGFIGGVIAGGNHAGFVGTALLSLGCAFGLLVATGHGGRRDGTLLGDVLGFSTFAPLPAGVIGYMVGKALWG